MPAERTLIGDCYSTWWCVECDGRLERNQINRSDTVCPHCGAKRKFAESDYYTKVYREITHQRRWLLWWRTMKIEYELVAHYDRNGKKVELGDSHE